MNTNEAKNIGEIYIADEVVSAIAGLAALEVEGVKAVASRLRISTQKMHIKK